VPTFPVQWDPRRDPRYRRPLTAPGVADVPDVAAARSAAALKHERRAGAVLDLHLDRCRLVFGQTNEFGTCTATGAACYQTFANCRDKENYSRGIRTDSYCSRGMPLPAGVPMRPYIEEVSVASSEIDPNKGLAVRSQTQVVVMDEPCPDTEDDPYIGTRSSPAQGTYWKRKVARQKVFAGRFAELRRGFVVEPWSWDTFQSELFILEGVRGPDAQGRFTIVLSDPIRLLDRVQIPVATDGKLAIELPALSFEGQATGGSANTVVLPGEASAIDGAYNGQEVYLEGGLGFGQRRVISGYVGATRTATVSINWSVNPDSTSFVEVAPLQLTLSSGKAAQYPDPALAGTLEYVRIGDEVIRYTAIAGDVLSWPDNTYREQFRTSRSDHGVDDGVQLCRAWSAASAMQVILDLIEEGGLDLQYVDVAQLQDQYDQWIGAAANITTCLTEPKRASDLLRDLLQDLNLLGWWDPVARQMKFKAALPEIGDVPLLTDDNLLEGYTSADPRDAERITRAGLYYDLRSATDNAAEQKNYIRGELRVDRTAESPDEGGDERPDIRFTRWMSAANSSFVGARVARRLGNFRDVPFVIHARLDPRDAVNLGDVRDIQSRVLVDEAGAPRMVRVRITKKKDMLTHLELEARTTNLGLRYGFIAPAGYPDYLLATEAQRVFAFIANAQGFMPDGTSAYLIP
jgi:hypothetical protein